jgi:hypothetical protein
MSLNKFSDFMQVISSITKHPTKIEHCSKHNLFSTIYLLKEQTLNHRNYSKQKINMSYFIQSKKYDMNIHAKIQCIIMHGYL